MHRYCHFSPDPSTVAFGDLTLFIVKLHFMFLCQVLIETDLVQKESDNIGPHAELLGWKHRMAKFNYLLEQVKSPMCRNACGILKLAKSKYLDVSLIEIYWTL